MLIPGSSAKVRAIHGRPKVADAAATALPWTLYTPARRWLLLAVLFLVATANYFDYFILSVLLEPIKKEFGVSDTMLGLLSGFCFAVIYSLAALPLARWADRGNRRTVITITLIAWSAMTSLCGLAQSFWQLALARFGVGATEPGALPAAQSLVGDYFPTEQRGRALSLLQNGGSAAGWLLGIGFGGLIAAKYGWRMAFILAGALSLMLSVLVRLTLSEPRTLAGVEGSLEEGESLRATLSGLSRKRSFVLTLIGFSFYGIFTYGMMVFVPSFLIRSLHASLQQVSITWGVVIATANLLGALMGGWLTDRLSRQDVRWYAWVPALACALGAPLYALAFSADSLQTFILLEFVAEFVIAMGIPMVFATALSVSGAHRRAVASAALLCSVVMVGGNIGPLFVGALSDVFSSAYGVDSLRYALLCVLLFLVPAAMALGWAGRQLPDELED